MSVTKPFERVTLKESFDKGQFTKEKLISIIMSNT